MNIYEKQNQKLLEQIKQGKRVNPLKVIHYKCLDCVCFNVTEVRQCPVKDCILWAFRFGKNPVKRAMSEKQMENAKKQGDRWRKR